MFIQRCMKTIPPTRAIRHLSLLTAAQHRQRRCKGGEEPEARRRGGGGRGREGDQHQYSDGGGDASGASLCGKANCNSFYANDKCSAAVPLVSSSPVSLVDTNASTTAKRKRSAGETVKKTTEVVGSTWRLVGTTRNNSSSNYNNNNNSNGSVSRRSVYGSVRYYHHHHNHRCHCLGSHPNSIAQSLSATTAADGDNHINDHNDDDLHHLSQTHNHDNRNRNNNDNDCNNNHNNNDNDNSNHNHDNDSDNNDHFRNNSASSHECDMRRRYSALLASLTLDDVLRRLQSSSLTNPARSLAAHFTLVDDRDDKSNDGANCTSNNSNNSKDRAKRKSALRVMPPNITILKEQLSLRLLAEMGVVAEHTENDHYHWNDRARSSNSSSSGDSNSHHNKRNNKHKFDYSPLSYATTLPHSMSNNGGGGGARLTIDEVSLILSNAIRHKLSSALVSAAFDAFVSLLDGSNRHWAAKNNNATSQQNYHVLRTQEGEDEKEEEEASSTLHQKRVAEAATQKSVFFSSSPPPPPPVSPPPVSLVQPSFYYSSQYVTKAEAAVRVLEALVDRANSNNSDNRNSSRNCTGDAIDDHNESRRRNNSGDDTTTAAAAALTFSTGHNNDDIVRVSATIAADKKEHVTNHLFRKHREEKEIRMRTEDWAALLWFVESKEFTQFFIPALPSGGGSNNDGGGGGGNENGGKTRGRGGEERGGVSNITEMSRDEDGFYGSGGTTTRGGSNNNNNNNFGEFAPVTTATVQRERQLEKNLLLLLHFYSLFLSTSEGQVGGAETFENSVNGSADDSDVNPKTSGSLQNSKNDEKEDTAVSDGNNASISTNSASLTHAHRTNGFSSSSSSSSAAAGWISKLFRFEIDDSLLRQQALRHCESIVAQLMALQLSKVRRAAAAAAAAVVTVETEDILRGNSSTHNSNSMQRQQHKKRQSRLEINGGGGKGKGKGKGGGDGQRRSPLAVVSAQRLAPPQNFLTSEDIQQICNSIERLEVFERGGGQQREAMKRGKTSKMSLNDILGASVMRGTVSGRVGGGGGGGGGGAVTVSFSSSSSASHGTSADENERENSHQQKYGGGAEPSFSSHVASSSSPSSSSFSSSSRRHHPNYHHHHHHHHSQQTARRAGTIWELSASWLSKAVAHLRAKGAGGADASLLRGGANSFPSTSLSSSSSSLSADAGERPLHLLVCLCLVQHLGLSAKAGSNFGGSISVHRCGGGGGSNSMMNSGAGRQPVLDIHTLCRVIEIVERLLIVPSYSSFSSSSSSAHNRTKWNTSVEAWGSSGVAAATTATASGGGGVFDNHRHHYQHQHSYYSCTSPPPPQRQQQQWEAVFSALSAAASCVLPLSQVPRSQEKYGNDNYNHKNNNNNNRGNGASHPSPTLSNSLLTERTNNAFPFSPSNASTYVSSSSFVVFSPLMRYTDVPRLASLAAVADFFSRHAPAEHHTRAAALAALADGVVFVRQEMRRVAEEEHRENLNRSRNGNGNINDGYRPIHLDNSKHKKSNLENHNISGSNRDSLTSSKTNASAPLASVEEEKEAEEEKSFVLWYRCCVLAARVSRSLPPRREILSKTIKTTAHSSSSSYSNINTAAHTQHQYHARSSNNSGSVSDSATVVDASEKHDNALLFSCLFTIAEFPLTNRVVSGGARLGAEEQNRNYRKNSSTQGNGNKSQEKQQQDDSRTDVNLRSSTEMKRRMTSVVIADTMVLAEALRRAPGVVCTSRFSIGTTEGMGSDNSRGERRRERRGRTRNKRGHTGNDAGGDRALIDRIAEILPQNWRVITDGILRREEWNDNQNNNSHRNDNNNSSEEEAELYCAPAEALCVLVRCLYAATRIHQLRMSNSVKDTNNNSNKNNNNYIIIRNEQFLHSISDVLQAMNVLLTSGNNKNSNNTKNNNNKNSSDASASSLPFISPSAATPPPPSPPPTAASVRASIHLPTAERQMLREAAAYLRTLER